MAGNYILDYSLMFVNVNLDYFQRRKGDGVMIYKRIAQLCAEKGISISRLERETGISNGTISRWEKSSPTAENLAKVADYFGTSVDYLMGRVSA